MTRVMSSRRLAPETNDPQYSVLIVAVLFEIRHKNRQLGLKPKKTFAVLQLMCVCLISCVIKHHNNIISENKVAHTVGSRRLSNLQSVFF